MMIVPAFFVSTLALAASGPTLAHDNQVFIRPDLPLTYPVVAASNDDHVIQVSNRRVYRRPSRYSGPPRRYYYSPGYPRYNQRYYPGYYGTRRYGYYNYGYGRGSVRVGPVQVWW